MVEKDVEKKLRTWLKHVVKGALCLKFVSPGYTGVPDRIILLPGGRIVFAELKRPKEKERKRQEYVQGKLRELGFEVFSSVDSAEKLHEVVHRYMEIASASKSVDSVSRAYTLGGSDCGNS